MVNWYEKRGFSKKESYLHVYAEAEECGEACDTKIPMLFLCSCFGHYVGENKGEIRRKFKRVHECNLYEMLLPG